MVSCRLVFGILYKSLISSVGFVVVDGSGERKFGKENKQALMGVVSEEAGGPLSVEEMVPE